MSAASPTTECGPKTTKAASKPRRAPKAEQATPTAGREAWDAAYAAWRAAEAAEASDDAEADALGAAAADAHAALIRLPAPDLEAVAAKLSFYGEFTRFNAFLDEEKAGEILEGDDWLLECVAAAYLDVRRLARSGRTSGASSEAWDLAVSALGAAYAEERRLLAALGEACDAVERDAPIPEILKRENGGYYFLEDQIAGLSVPFDQKVEMVATLRDWWPVRQAAGAAHRTEELNQEWDSHNLSPSEDALMATPAPNISALALKLAMALSREHGLALEDLQTPEQIAELLSNSDAEARDYVLAYQDALRLAGERPDLVAAKAFDVQAWISAFEAHPGHHVTRSGRPSYEEPQAYGADTPAYNDIKVVEPEAIARFDAYQRSHYTDEQWAAAKADRLKMGYGIREDGHPFVAQCLDHLEGAYPDGGAEFERLKALWDLRHDRLANGTPTGARLWRDLPEWQKQAVRDFCKANAEQFPDHRWWPETWVEAFEAAGGSFSLAADGSFFAGSTVPMSFFTARLMNALDQGDLRDRVRDIFISRCDRAACEMLEEYEAAGGHICLTFNPETGEDTGVCVRVTAPMSERTTQIEGMLSGPWRRHFMRVLQNSFRFASAKLARGDFNTEKATMRLADEQRAEAGQ